MSKTQVTVFDSYHAAVAHIVSKNSPDGIMDTCVYAAIPDEEHGTNMVHISDGVAFDYGYVQFNEDTNTYSAHVYQYGI